MKILFLSLCYYDSIEDRDIYTDLLRVFIRNGHKVWIVSPVERRQKINTRIVKEPNCRILHVKTGNIQKTNILEKGVSTVLLEMQFVAAIKKYLSGVKFDLILYATPPITIAKTVEFIKQRDTAKTYLMLKDIFPQNAVDIGMMSKRGMKGCLYRYFRKKEKKLYKLSDMIGCMSQANVDYVLRNNPEISAEKVEICPNSVEVIDMSVSLKKREEIRMKYEIPLEKIVFLYGGNLGKPQGIEFFIQCMRSERDNVNIFFLIVGDGTEYKRLAEFVKIERPRNVKLMNRLPKKDYEYMVGSCDVGMLFLDHRFTIPNFPSRLLDYMQAKLPVFAVTDTSTDIGEVITSQGFGWWSESNNVQAFQKNIDVISKMGAEGRDKLGERAWEVLLANYSVDVVYKQFQEGIMGMNSKRKLSEVQI